MAVGPLQRSSAPSRVPKIASRDSISSSVWAPDIARIFSCATLYVSSRSFLKFACEQHRDPCASVAHGLRNK